MPTDRTTSRARRVFLQMIGRGGGAPSSAEVISAANASATSASSPVAPRSDSRARRAAAALHAQGVADPSSTQVIEAANRSYGDAA